MLIQKCQQMWATASNSFFYTLKGKDYKERKVFFANSCTESYLLIKSGAQSDASVWYRTGKINILFKNCLMQSNQKAGKSFRSSHHFSVWTHIKSELRSWRVLWDTCQTDWFWLSNGAHFSLFFLVIPNCEAEALGFSKKNLVYCSQD